MTDSEESTLHAPRSSKGRTSHGSRTVNVKVTRRRQTEVEQGAMSRAIDALVFEMARQELKKEKQR